MPPKGVATLRASLRSVLRTLRPSRRLTHPSPLYVILPQICHALKSIDNSAYCDYPKSIGINNLKYNFVKLKHVQNYILKFIVYCFV